MTKPSGQNPTKPDTTGVADLYFDNRRTRRRKIGVWFAAGSGALAFLAVAVFYQFVANQPPSDNALTLPDSPGTSAAATLTTTTTAAPAATQPAATDNVRGQECNDIGVFEPVMLVGDLPNYAPEAAGWGAGTGVLDLSDTPDVFAPIEVSMIEDTLWRWACQTGAAPSGWAAGRGVIMPDVMPVTNSDLMAAVWSFLGGRGLLPAEVSDSIPDDHDAAIEWATMQGVVPFERTGDVRVAAAGWEPDSQATIFHLLDMVWRAESKANPATFA